MEAQLGAASVLPVSTDRWSLGEHLVRRNREDLHLHGCQSLSITNETSSFRGQLAYGYAYERQKGA